MIIDPLATFSNTATGFVRCTSSGGLTLNAGTYTNNGVFKANSGNIGSAATGVTFTNYAAGTQTLTGGTYWVIGPHTMTLGGIGNETQLTGSENFTLLTADSGITGAFDNVANGMRLNVTNGIGSFQLHYGAGSAFAPQYVVLSNYIPEPTTTLLAVVCAGSFLFPRPHRRRQQ